MSRDHAAVRHKAT